MLGKIDAPLMERLNGVEWGEYRLGDLFDIDSTSSFDANSLTAGDEYDYVTRTLQNQGILRGTGYVNINNINPAGNWSLGLLQMDFFYRRKPWYAGQFVRKITPKIKIEGNAILFFQTILNMQKQRLLQVLVRNVDETFRNLVVKLPRNIRNGSIDFEFIDSFIAELHAYLTVTGLTDYTLTAEERMVFEQYDTWQWNKFNLEALYGKSTRGKRLKSEDRTHGPLPFVTAGEAEEGVSAFISNPVQVFSAIQKLIIKDVVRYADRMIRAYKSVVDSNK